MDNKFFIPYRGSKYNQGINGKKILVLGASFYCDKCNCQFFDKCTNTIYKNSENYDAICPTYKCEGKMLHNEPSYCIEDAPQTYQNFASFMSPLCENGSYEEVWERMAFTNYVQFFLPSEEGKYRVTLNSDLSERDFKAFIEVLNELKPNIVIIWGCVINSRLKEQNEYVVNISELKRTEDYVCHMRIPGVVHDIELINPYHPSSSAWSTNVNQQKFKKHLSSILQ